MFFALIRETACGSLKILTHSQIQDFRLSSRRGDPICTVLFTPYLLKPVSKQDLNELFHRFFERTLRPLEILEINTGTKIYTFPLNCVQKIQSNNKGVDIYLQHIPIPFIRVEEQIDSRSFLRISRGLLVSNSYIRHIDKNVCYFSDGTSALISRREKNTVRKKYNDW